MQLVPRWHEHWTSNKVYDGDMIVLQGQEKTLSGETSDAAEINRQYSKLTFTPTQADRLVLAFRSWLRRHGGGQPDWAPGTSLGPLPSTVLSRRQVYLLFHFPFKFFFLQLLHFKLSSVFKIKT